MTEATENQEQNNVTDETTVAAGKVVETAAGTAPSTGTASTCGPMTA